MEIKISSCPFKVNVLNNVLRLPSLSRTLKLINSTNGIDKAVKDIIKYQYL